MLFLLTKVNFITLFYLWEYLTDCKKRKNKILLSMEVKNETQKRENSSGNRNYF